MLFKVNYAAIPAVVVNKAHWSPGNAFIKSGVLNHAENVSVPTPASETPYSTFKPKQHNDHSSIINIYMSGGTGGTGGASETSLGGTGGRGDGPVFNNNSYNMDSKELTINAGMRLLHDAAANEASHDSGESYGRPPCLPDTRTNYLSHLNKWSCQNASTQSLLWMYGAAGTGKSAIAQSFCEHLQEEHCLGGSFFFKRGHPTRQDALKLFPTLAYQLAVASGVFKAAVAPVVARDPSVLKKSLLLQMQKLIIEPYKTAMPTCIYTLVIDGLDECRDENLQQIILRCLGEVQLPTLRVLVASRPEAHLRSVLHSLPTEQLAIQGSFEDIRLFFCHHFERIHNTHEAMTETCHPWPDYNVVNTLTCKSSGHFIYAATVIRFIEDSDSHPVKRLELVYNMQEQDMDGKSDSPFAALDQLYKQVLGTVKVVHRPMLLKILFIIETGFHSRFGLSNEDIGELLGLEPPDFRLTLRRVYSVMNENHLTFYHASFSDFLTNAMRAGEFHLNDVVQHSLVLAVAKIFAHCPQNEFTYPSNHITGRQSQILFLDKQLRTQLDWLESHNAPMDLIQKWNDYIWMSRFSHFTFRPPLSELHGTSDPQPVAAVSPQCLKIIQAYTLLQLDSSRLGYITPFLQVRWVLDISWETMTEVVVGCRQTSASDLADAVHPSRIRELRCNGTLQIIAERSLQLVAKAYPYELGARNGWSCILRSCSPSQELFNALRALFQNKYIHYSLGSHIYGGSNENGFHLHNIKAWLKTQPNPPTDLIRPLGLVQFPQECYEVFWMKWKQLTGL
ncbi:hypothetical protein R3P38DRAFT_2759402 [Favolaschia claudopus]|uniref:NACHT domain-containing protein n=1 Tax=Favolaschia claudopus TaxID=2862362 RepID=A0AAW0EAJ1_9AGAR